MITSKTYVIKKRVILYITLLIYFLHSIIVLTRNEVQSL